MLYTFGCLVLPALIAKNVCREVRPMFLVAPVVAVATGAVGFMLANHYDFPPAQMTVALLSFLLMVAWLLPRMRRGTG
jgi:ABC-type Mn2+/Zn2+ transport system permease subunit